MAKNLVIVESPAKAKTIEKFLGKDFKVESCFGHIRDLPSKELGVEIDKNFEPKYKISADKKSVVKKLKDLTKNAELVWLASDEDREGEAIAWHLSDTLKLTPDNTRRIVFHEITKTAIQKAIENPRGIDYDLVDAQQARRVLDRIVGYELSPVLWRKIKSGLSAGRVQSVAVRLIVEREKEIQQFQAKTSYKIEAQLMSANDQFFKASLPKNLETEQEAHEFLTLLINAELQINSIVKKPVKKSPAAPFTTSTLQQEASRKLGFPVGKTMMVAQRLYEAGFITYMRTDSVNLSGEALHKAQEQIYNQYGENYHKLRQYRSKSKSAQEAHEAIRPTDLSKSQLQLERDQSKLYQLIWKRTIASQMSDAQLEKTQVKIGISNSKKEFVAEGEVIAFDGFLKVYKEGNDLENIEQQGLLPKMQEKEILSQKDIKAIQRFSRPPYRFSEAALVKTLEELGIGRPSTYAPTISTIQKRNYIEKGTLEGIERNYTVLHLLNGEISSKQQTEKTGSIKGKLIPTDMGYIVTDFLINHFGSIMKYNFTAQVEESFDSIAEGKKDWAQMIKSFYQDFHPTVEDVKENAQRESGERILGQDPKTGRQVSVRLGRFGPMVQIGKSEEEEKPLFASLSPEHQLNTITLEESLSLFNLPRNLGVYKDEEILVNNGRYGPYVKYGEKFVSLPRGTDLFQVELEEAIIYIQNKEKADAPIYNYKDIDVTKGKGRFGPFIKWNNMFINVNKKYDWDNLSKQDIEQLIEDKLKKEREKLIQHWQEEGIKIEKGRWGRHYIIKGKTKVELDKTVDAANLTLKQAQGYLETKKKKK